MILAPAVRTSCSLCLQHYKSFFQLNALRQSRFLNNNDGSQAFLWADWNFSDTRSRADSTDTAEVQLPIPGARERGRESRGEAPNEKNARCKSSNFSPWQCVLTRHTWRPSLEPSLRTVAREGRDRDPITILSFTPTHCYSCLVLQRYKW